MTKKLRFALIGAGGIAQTWAQAFERSQTAELVAVADVREDVAAALAEGLGCRSYASHTALFKGEQELDAVVISTPPATHPEIAKFFLSRKVNVLCEKPLSIDSDSAKEMLATAKVHGVTLTMATKFRYVDDVVRAKSIAASGLIGEIVLFENAFTAHVDMSSRWNSNTKLSGGGVLIDNGTHSLDLMRYFLGPVVDVQVIEGRRSQGLEVEETVRIFVRSTAGVLGSIDLSWSINKEQESYINIYGSQGTISVGWKESKYRLSSSRDWVVFGQGYDKVQAFGSQIDNFCGSLRGEEELLITAEDALASVEVIEAAYAALERDSWTPVKERAA
jgi:predicted dehydrogenase